MPTYLYTGLYDRVYPEIMTSDGSLHAVLGDVRDFEVPPDDAWVEHKPDAKKAQPPAKAAAADKKKEA